MSALLALPAWQLYFLAAGFGVIIGSFLNVFIYRFRTGKSLSGSSHCMSCQSPLSWYDLFPLLSYIVLRGRCRCCTARIPSRYFWVELITSLLFVAVVALVPAWWLWPLLWVLVSVLVVIVVYDITHMVIPNSLVYVLGVLAVIHVAYEWYVVPDFMQVLYRLLAALIGFGFFAGLWKYSEGRWIGFGDAKLAIPLSLMVGILGTFSMIVLAFWIGTIISLALMAAQWYRQKRGQPHLRFVTERLTMKSEVPFAPFLILSFLIVYLLRIDVVTLMSYVTPV